MSIRNQSAFRIEATWMDQLSREAWFRVPKPLATKGGELVGVVDYEGDQRAVMMTRWIPGRKSRQRATLEHASLLGRVSATLHKHARSIDIENIGAIKVWNIQRMTASFLNSARLEEVFPEAGALTETTNSLLDDTLKIVKPDDFGLINADLGTHNVLWHRSGPGVVDFNDAGVGPYAFCLARLRAGLYQYQNGQELAAALIRGYRQISPLPDGIGDNEGVFELAADLFIAHYASDRAMQQNQLTRRKAQLLFRSSMERLDALQI